MGSAGFLCESWEYMRSPDLTASQSETLQRDTFFGQEKKSLAYVIGVISVKNPNAPEEAPLRSPEQIIADMLARDAETAKILENIRAVL